MKTESQLKQSDKPLFLYISPKRLILMSIATISVFQIYWMYKNWQYIKERYRLNILPFWRAIFGIFYIHSLLRCISEDKEGSAIKVPLFSVTGLATGWVVLIILSIFIAFYEDFVALALAALIPSYLCLVPVQNYINSMINKRNPNSKMYGWSTGHIVLLVLGLLTWIVSFISDI